MMRKLQKLGKALMLPVATLPLGGLMLGIGYAIDPIGWGSENIIAAFLVFGGKAILDNMGILFAIGLGYGLTDDNDGTGALAALVSFLMMTMLLGVHNVGNFLGGPLTNGHTMLEGVDIVTYSAFKAIDNKNVFLGIIAGLIGSGCYMKFRSCKLPAALSFFGGKRSVAIITGIVTMFASIILLFAWPMIFGALTSFGQSVISLGPIGAGLYAFFNRLLIPTGLHHALNNVFWFDLAGINDLGNFWAGTGVTGETGMYMTGFFPIMMFGLPAAAFAMYRCAKPEKRKMAGSLLGAAALTSFVTGATEPLEFAFMFLSPVLYFVHALLSGLVVGLVAALDVRAGFNFSAGLIDMVLCLPTPHALNVWMLIPIGLAVAAIYYVVFTFMIKKFNLKTPGREDDDLDGEQKIVLSNDNFTEVARGILEGLGGASNITEIDHCVTRLRLEVKDQALVNEKKIKASGASGVIRPSKTSVQVIIGTQVQFVHDELKKLYKQQA